MDRLKKPKEFLKKLRLTDSDYQDSGMINHIADLLERYHTEQLNLCGVMPILPKITSKEFSDYIKINYTRCSLQLKDKKHKDIDEIVSLIDLYEAYPNGLTFEIKKVDKAFNYLVDNEIVLTKPLIV